MHASQRFLIAIALFWVFLGGGCVGYDVVYVDENGRELAVDDRGQPIVPGPTRRTVEFVHEDEMLPPADSEVTAGDELRAEPGTVIIEYAPTEALPVSKAGGDKPASSDTPASSGAPDSSGAPAPDPAWKLTPTPRGGKTLPTKRTVAPAKKVESSSNLDRPPAG